MTERDYDVGYGKPPRHTQFRPGRSGNPKGKRKYRAATFRTIIDRIYDRKVQVVEGGFTTRRTIRQLIISQLANKASKGDYAAFKVLLEFKEYAKSRKETPGIIIQYAPDAKFSRRVAKAPTVLQSTSAGR